MLAGPAEIPQDPYAPIVVCLSLFVSALDPKPQSFMLVTWPYAPSPLDMLV